MADIIFIADCFAPDVNGGAENYDSVLLAELRARGHHIITFISDRFHDEDIKQYGKAGFIFLIANHWSLPDRSKKFLQLDQYTYYIIEHDHQYLTTRNAAEFKDCLAPADKIKDHDFYMKAKNVFCQSTKHAEIMFKNINSLYFSRYVLKVFHASP